MLIFLNIALLCLATAGTLAAFAGETWDKEKRTHPFHRRVTIRGWISLSCLALALLLGVLKEFGTRAEERRKDYRIATERILEKKEAAANKEALISANRELSANQHEPTMARSDLSRVIDLASRSQQELIKVHSNLDLARTDLSRASMTGLINTLSSNRQNISEVWFIVPLKKPVKDPKELTDLLLPPHAKEQCPDSTWTTYVATPSLDYSVVVMGSGSSFLHNFIQNETLIDVSRLKSAEFRYTVANLMHDGKPNYLGYTGTTQYFFVSRIRPSRGGEISASKYLTYLSQWQMAISFAVMQQGLSLCARPTLPFRQSLFDTGMLVVFMGEKRNDSIGFTLKALPEQIILGSSWNVDFKVDSEPLRLLLTSASLNDEVGTLLDNAPSDIVLQTLDHLVKPSATSPSQ